MTGAPLLSGRGLARHHRVGPRFARRRAVLRAVDGVDVDVGRGEILGLVGESGSGKTTLVRLLLRLIEPTAGTVTFDGVDLTRLDDRALRPYRRRMQVVFQGTGATLDPRRTVGSSVAEGLRVQRLVQTAADARDRAAAALAQVGLDPALVDRRPHALSGGQRQRVGIARALVLDPDLLVADEPVSALDASVRGQVLNLLLALRDARDMAILLVSHDLEVVATVADRVAVMSQGRLVEVGATEDVIHAPRHAATRALLDAIPARHPRERRRPLPDLRPPG